MSHFGKRVRVTTLGGNVLVGVLQDYHRVHICVGGQWVALDRIKTLEPI